MRSYRIPSIPVRPIWICVSRQNRAVLCLKTYIQMEQAILGAKREPVCQAASHALGPSAEDSCLTARPDPMRVDYDTDVRAFAQRLLGGNVFEPVTFAGITLPLISFILFGAALAFLLIVQVARTMISNKLQNLFASKLYDEFLDTVDEPLTRFFIPAYNRTYLRLNAFMAKGSVEKAMEAFDQLLAMRSTRAQRDDLLFKAFQFYMQQEDFKGAKAVLDEMQSYGRHEKRVEECVQAYEIFGNNSYAYIDEMEAAFDEAPYALKVSYALMLAAQYTSKKDGEAAEKWQDTARELLENPPKKGPAETR